MDEATENILNKIHEIVVSEDYLLVPFSSNNETMAIEVIKNVEKKLINIAELCRVGLGD